MAAPSYVGKASSAGYSSSRSVNISGFANGSLALFFVGFSAPAPTTVPPGVTRIATSSGLGTYYTSCYLYWKVKEAGDTTFTWGWGSSYNVQVVAIEVSGQNEADPIIGTAKSSANSGTAVSTPGVATDEGDTLYVHGVSNDAGRSVTFATGTERHDLPRSVGSGHSLAIATDTTTPGSARTATLNAGAAHAAVAVLVRGPNRLPLAPTDVQCISITAPDTSIDRGAEATFTWSHNDEDGDAEADAELRWRQGGGWTTVPRDSAGTVAIDSLTFATGELEVQVRTSDLQGYGDWSESVFFTVADRPTAPTITSPPDAGTVTTPTDTVTLTHSGSPDAMRIEVLSTDEATTHHTSGVTPFATTYNDELYPAAANGGDVLLQASVREEGLWSAVDEHTVTVDYEDPPTPTFTVDTWSKIHVRVRVTNPTPTGDQPDLAHNEVHRRESSDGGATWANEAGTGPYSRVAAELPEDGTFEDWAVRDRKRRTYQYRIRAVGDTGATATTGWQG